jgi:hypothetical protein
MSTGYRTLKATDFFTFPKAMAIIGVALACAMGLGVGGVFVMGLTQGKGW